MLSLFVEGSRVATARAGAEVLEQLNAQLGRTRVDVEADLVKTKLEIKVPELVLLEFRGSILREPGAKENALSQVRALANDLDRADKWKGGVSSLRAGCDAVAQDIDGLRKKLDPFLTTGAEHLHRRAAHTGAPLSRRPPLHARTPPDEPKRGVQDCRIFEAVLDIARRDRGIARPGRFFLTKDGDFLKKSGVREELETVGVKLVNDAGKLYGCFR